MRSMIKRASALAVVALAVLAPSVSATTYFQDDFSNSNWASRWVESTHRPSYEYGAWGLSAGTYYNDANKDKGLQTTQDARFYALSAEFPQEFSNQDKTLVVQYTVKMEQDMDCGGGYVKLLPASLDQSDFNGDTAHNIMFGPDFCGSSTAKVHVGFRHGSSMHLTSKTIPAPHDVFTHIYRLVVAPTNTYKVYIDGAEVESGSLEDDFDMLPPKKIPDPLASKPLDWVDDETICDPNAVQQFPEQYIVDPNAAKPVDWDDELDGEWVAPLLSNPAYPWTCPQISNSLYKGPWVHPEIDNPNYTPDENLYAYSSNKYLGIDVWQVKSGTIFDNFLISDNESDADTLLALWETQSAGEHAAYDLAH